MTWRNDNIANRLPMNGMVARCVMSTTIGMAHKFGLSRQLGFRST